MATRQIKRRPLRKIPVGDMRDWITLYTRSITAPGYDSAALSEEYTSLCSLWSKHETLELDTAKFDDVQILSQPTDRFVIRFIPGLTSENILEWDGDYFKILSINDYEGRKEYLQLKCRLKGDNTLEANT